MNYYVNCTPKNCQEYESITLDVATEDAEAVLYYARVLADEKNVTARRAFGDIVKDVYEKLLEKNYDRKNRKNRKR